MFLAAGGSLIFVLQSFLVCRRAVESADAFFSASEKGTLAGVSESAGYDVGFCLFLLLLRQLSPLQSAA